MSGNAPSMDNSSAMIETDIRYLFAERNLEGAQRRIEEALEQDGEDAELHALAGEVYFRSRDYARALKEFEIARQAGPISINHADLAMRAAYSEGELDRAAEFADEILNEDAGHESALTRLGRIQNQRRDWSAALETWTKLANIDPNREEAHIQVMRGYYRAKDWPSVLKWAHRVLELSPSNIDAQSAGATAAFRLIDYDAFEPLCLGLANHGAEAALKFARQVHDRGEYSIAARILVAFQSDDPVLNRDCQELKAEWLKAWNDNALRAELRKNDTEASRYFVAIKALDPVNEFAERGLSRVRRYAATEMRKAYRDDDVPSAIRYAREALKVDPTFVEAWMLIGRALFGKDRFEEALDHFKRAADLDPNSTFAFLNIARCHLRLHNYKDAVLNARAVSSIAHKGETAYVREAERTLASIARQALLDGRDALEAEEWLRAKELVARIEDADPGSEQAANLRQKIIRALVKQMRTAYKDQSDTAIEFADHVLELDPNHAKALLISGRALIKARNYESAVDRWSKLCEIEPSVPLNWLMAARCHDRMRHQASAFSAASRLLELEPNHEEAQKLIERNQPEV